MRSLGNIAMKPHAHPLITLFLFAAAGLLCGCGGGDSTSPALDPDPPLVDGAIDEGGGELVDDQVVLTVPGGALDGETRLAIYAETDAHPFGDAETAVYRISGLPGELGAPLTLRIRHDLALTDGDTLTIFLGEEREAYSDGSGLSWYSVAGRDSAGWAICELERGALPLGGKSDGDVKTAVSRKVRVLTTAANRFELIYRDDEVGRTEATEALLTFDQVYDIFLQWGFDFGPDDSIWPLDVYIREPIKSIACYVTAPHGKGHFDFDPSLLQPGVQLTPVIAHEMFHCVQTFYDPRDPEQWGVLNQERLWLDEATAAYLEAVANTNAEVYPIGLNDDNYAAPLAGLSGHPYLSNANFGYGMSQFIQYMAGEANPEVGEQVVVDLYEHFRRHGDVTDAIDAEVSPPVAEWIVDFHRQWAENRIFPAFLVNWFWYQWPFGDTLDAEAGSEASDTVEIADLGADLVKFVIGDQEPGADTELVIDARRTDQDLPAEALPITVYGRRLNGTPEPLATGTDQVLLDDWPALHATYQDILVMVSRPYSTAAGHTGKRDIEVGAAIREEVPSYDVTAFTNAVIEVRTDNTFTNASGVIPNDLIGIQAAVSWNGAALMAAAPGDTFIIPVDPVTLALGDWYGAERYTAINGNWIVKRLAGRAIPLDSWDETGIYYRMGGAATCDHLTRVFESKAADEESDPFQVLTGYSCSDGDHPWDRSGISIHLYRAPPDDRER